jgi:hypothetical protein
VIEAAVPAWSLAHYGAAHVIVLVDSLTEPDRPHAGIWIDVAHRTPAETVDEILAATR